MAFDDELEFEQALVNELVANGWTDGILNHPTEKDLLDNWAKILFENNRQIDRLNDYPLTDTEMQQIIEQKIEDLDFNVDEFEDAYMNLSSVSVNVGNVIRKGIFDYTLAALQGFKKTWFNCLINK